LIVENFLFGGGLIYESGEVTSYLRPESQRDFMINWDEAPTFGMFWVTQEVHFLDETHSVRKLVLIIPLWLFVLILVILIGLILRAIWHFKKAKERKAKHKK
jgi:hypothetical protein